MSNFEWRGEGGVGCYGSTKLLFSGFVYRTDGVGGLGEYVEGPIAAV